MVIQFISSKEGSGASILSTSFAVSWAQVTKQRVLLVDCSEGDISFILGLKSKKSLRELAEYSKVLDQGTWSLFVGIHKTGVHCLTSQGDLTQAGNLVKHFEVLSKIYDLIVFDAGKVNQVLSDLCCELAQASFIVVNQDPLSVQQGKKSLAFCLTKLLPRESLFVLINGVQNQNPFTVETIKQQLQFPVLTSFPRDEAVCVQSLLRAQPFVLTPSSLSKVFLEFVQRVYQTNLLKNLQNLSKPVQQLSEEQKKLFWLELKERVHRLLVEEVDIKKHSQQSNEELVLLKERTKKVIVDLVQREDQKKFLNSKELLAQFVKEVLDEALGLGPLEDLLRDKNITEIMVVGHKKIYYEQAGKVKISPVVFTSDRQALNVIERIVAPIGRRIDEKTPYVDARLRDGSRVHAIIPPCAIDGPTITIRKFPEERLSYKRLVEFNSLTQEMADFLRIAVEAHKNIIVSGGTGSGKTTLINILASFIPANERIITCEDSAELNLPQEHVVRLETRPPNLEGDGAIDIRTLVKQTLRMRPDRIVVGECRGGEALDMLQAMNTGHEGSLTTVHSNTPRDCIARLETLVQYSGANLTPKGIKEMIASAVHLIVQQSRLDDGSRKIINITEVVGIQSDVVTLQDIFVFKQTGVDQQGKIIGKFQGTGFIPTFVEKLEKKGYRIPRGIFRINS